MLVIFFAGHGVMQGAETKKQFYFLTADASTASATSAIGNVGISMTELTEWIKPANIKAQKRILIFDACNSGQAIRDFVQFGKAGQGFVAARNDEKAQQIKAIEKLNNQSGLFILAASASNQSAYEMGRYSQGLLTYSLLKAIKHQPDILENGKYLDVSNWLNAAKKTVTILAEESGERQEPQLNASNNFNIGVVDEGVRSKIILSASKPVFSSSNFQNTDTKTDNLKLRGAINKQLIKISIGSNAPITYSADYDGADVYALNGDYKIIDGSVVITALLTKGGVELYRYEVKGNAADIETITSSITAPAMEWVKKK
jgi:flagellar biosynthesis/type III secretory pathway chaperone